jgi:PAS domain S-box-containing protein
MFDLILCDQQLADGPGLDFLLELDHEDHPAFRILVTGIGHSAEVDLALGQGRIQFCLDKPLRGAGLMRLLSLVEERWQLRRQNHELLDRLEGLGEDLALTQSMYRRLVEHLPHGILLCDRQGRILMANPQAGQAAGMHAQALVGRSAASLFGVEWPEGECRGPQCLAGKLARPDGRALAVGLTVAPVAELEERPCLVFFDWPGETGRP